MRGALSSVGTGCKREKTVSERLGGEKEGWAGRERTAQVERGEPIRGRVIEEDLPNREMFTVRWPGARVCVLSPSPRHTRPLPRPISPYIPHQTIPVAARTPTATIPGEPDAQGRQRGQQRCVVSDLISMQCPYLWITRTAQTANWNRTQSDSRRALSEYVTRWLLRLFSLSFCHDRGRGGLGGLRQGRVPPRPHRRRLLRRQVSSRPQARLGPFFHRMARKGHKVSAFFSSHLPVFPFRTIILPPNLPHRDPRGGGRTRRTTHRARPLPPLRCAVASGRPCP